MDFYKIDFTLKLRVKICISFQFSIKIVNWAQRFFHGKRFPLPYTNSFASLLPVLIFEFKNFDKRNWNWRLKKLYFKKGVI